jgi:glycosyltransferase involved in cell wall biosynthesis
MARRVPVIGGSTAGAVPHVLKHGLCGALCDVSSPEFLYDTMVKIIENKQYANNLINKATEVLCEEYSGTMVAKRHIELYMSI